MKNQIDGEFVWLLRREGTVVKLLQLNKSWRESSSFWITTSSAVKGKLSKYGQVYVVRECNREHPLRVIMALASCLSIIIRQRPDVVISTGAAVGCITCLLGKLLGAKIVWIDSITNVERISLSGKLIRPIADLFIVQWPELAEKYGSVEYFGEVV